MPTDAPSSAPTTAPTPLCPQTSTSTLFLEGSWNPLGLKCGGSLVDGAFNKVIGQRYPGDNGKDSVIFSCGGTPSAADSQRFWQSAGYKFGYNLTMNRTDGMVTINFNGPIRYNNPNDSGHWFALGFPYFQNKQKLPGSSTPINTSLHDAYVIAFTKFDGTRNNDRNATIHTFRMPGTALDAQLVYQDRICQTNGMCSGYTQTTSPVTINSIRYLNGNVYVSVSRPMTASMPDDFAFSIDHFEGCGNALWVTYGLQPSDFVSVWIVNDTANPQLRGRGPHLWAVDVNIARPTTTPTAVPSVLPTASPTTAPTITQPALRYAIDWNTVNRINDNRTIDFKYSADVAFTDQTHISVRGPKNGARWIVFVRSWTIKTSQDAASLLDSPLRGSGAIYVQGSSFYMLMYDNITNTLCEVTDVTTLQCAGPTVSGTDIAAKGNQARIQFTFTNRTSIVKANGFTFKPNFMVGNRILICGIDDFVSDFYDPNIKPCEDVKDWTTNFGMYTRPITVAQGNLTTQLFIRRTPPKRQGVPEAPTIRLIMEADQNDFYCVGFFGYQGTFQLGTTPRPLGNGPFALCKQAANTLQPGFPASGLAQWWPGETSGCGATTKVCLSATRTTSGSRERWEVDFLFIPRLEDVFPLKTLMDKSRVRFAYLHGRRPYPSPWRDSVPALGSLLTGEAFFELAFQTEAPTFAPTSAPSMNPTSAPTGVPSNSPSSTPSTGPTSVPTTSPTISPTTTSWWEQQVNVTTIHATGTTITGCLSSAQNHSSTAYLNALATVGIDTGGLSAEIVRCYDPTSGARRLASASGSIVHAVTYGIRISGKPEWFRWKMLRVINYDLANFAKVLQQQLGAAPLHQKIVSIAPGTAQNVFIPVQCRDLPFPRICRFPIRVTVNRTPLIRVGERQFISIAFDQVKNQVAMRWERRGELAWWAYSFTSSNDSSVGKVIIATNHGANMTVYNLAAKSNGLNAGIVAGSGTVLSVTPYAYRGGLEYRINVSAATIGVNTQWKIIPILRFEFGILNTPYNQSASVVGGKGEVVNQLFMTPTLANTQIAPPNYIPSDQTQPPGVCGSNVGGTLGFFGLSLAGAGTQLKFSLKYECALSSVDVLIEGPSNRWWGILFGSAMINSPAIIYTTGANDQDTLTLHDYYIGSSRTLASVQKDPSQDWVILNKTSANGVVTIGARRPFVTGDMLDAMFSPRDTNITFGYAIGATQLQLAQHQFAKIYGTVSFLPIRSTSAPEKKRNAALVAAHGLLGVLGGMVFIPVAILIMRNRIMIQQTKDDEKFLLLHRIFNGIGALLLVVAVALGFVNVADFGSMHFSQGHHFGGVLIIAIVIFQITWAMLRPHYEPGEYKEPLRNAWEWVHFICGYLVVVLVGLQSFFGLVLASWTQFSLYLIMLAGVLILSWVIFEIIRRYSYYDFEQVDETEGLVDDDQTNVQMAKTSGASTLNFSGKSQTNITAATTSPRSESGKNDGVAFVE